MLSANTIFAITCWLCSLLFASIVFWSFKRQEPMHFWSGTTVKAEEITNVRSYNRANGLMWSVYALAMLTIGVLALFTIKTGAILLIVFCTLGNAVLIATYRRIYKKYKRRPVPNGEK